MLTLRLLATGTVVYRALSANVLIDEVEEIVKHRLVLCAIAFLFGRCYLEHSVANNIGFRLFNDRLCLFWRRLYHHRLRFCFLVISVATILREVR